MTRFHVLIAALSLALHGPSLAATAELKVSGNKIVTVAGNCPIFFKGGNLTSLEWKDVSDGPVLTSAQYLSANWGANIFRVPMNQARWLGTACGTNAAAYQAQYDSLINWCNANNVYVMLDLHWSDTGVAGGGSVCTSGQHDMPDNNSTSFWNSVATRYANNTAVMFDIYNEPKGITSWSLWRNGGSGMTDGVYTTPGMQALLNTIRATGARNIVVAGGLNWAFDLTGVPANALTDATGNGVVYATHIYPWKAAPCTNACFDAAVPAAVHNTYAVMVTEFGQNNGADGVPNNSWSQSVMNWAKANTNGYIAWCVHNSASPCLISDWSYTPTSWFGTTVKADMLATGAGGCVGTPTLTHSPSATPTPSRTATPLWSPTFTLSSTPTGTFSPTPTRSNSPAQSPTYTLTNTPTSALTATPAWSPSVTSTATRTPGSSPSFTFSPTLSSSPTPSRSATPTLSSSPTPTRTSSPTPSFSATGTFTLSPTSTLTPSRTSSPTVTSTPMGSLTFTPSATSSFTRSPTPGSTATPTLSSTPSAMPSVTLTQSLTPSATPTPSFSASPTFSHSSTASPSPAGTLTNTPPPTPSFTASPTPSVTSTLSPSPSPSSTQTPRPSDTASPTQTPRPSNTASPTRTPSPLGTLTSSPVSSATPSFTPTSSSTPTTAPSTPAPTAAGHPGQVVATLPSANPQGGGRLYISGKLDGSCEGFELRLFTKAETAMARAEIIASYGPGWQNLAFDGLELGNGIYYYQLRSINGGKASGLPRIGKVMILK